MLRYPNAHVVDVLHVGAWQQLAHPDGAELATAQPLVPLQTSHVSTYPPMLVNSAEHIVPEHL